MLGALRDEGHVLAALLHFADEVGQDGQGLVVERGSLELKEGGLEQIEVRVNFLLLPLVEALALFSRLGGEAGLFAHEFGHFEEIAAWFPVFPADFGIRELRGVMEGKQEESLHVAVRELCLGVIDLLLPLLALFGDGSDRLRPGSQFLPFDSL